MKEKLMKNNQLEKERQLHPHIAFLEQVWQG